jgi:hypothetical protein
MQGAAKIIPVARSANSSRSISIKSDADAKRHLQSAAIELDHTSCPTGVIEKLISRSDRS